MFIEDIKNDFYHVLLGNRVLLLVHYDVDAVCTCKILQELFKSDNISYTLVPVGGISELKTAYEDNSEEVKFVVLVNCGGTIDLVDILQPEEDVVFFVLDWHKPTDVCNVYSDGQVRLVYKDEEEKIPNFDDIFKDDEDEEEEESVGGREGLEAVVERRRERREWEERRNTLMFNYTQFSYYGKPSACVSLELCRRVSRGAGAAWAGGVAAAAAAAAHARSPAHALLDAEPLHAHAHAHAQHSQSVKLVLETDVWLPLYRWWSLEEALRHAPELAPYLRLHTLAGAGKLRQLLADMGVPLQQARQAYRSMEVELRKSVCSALEAACTKHSLPAPTRACCLLYRPLRPPSPAHDVAYAVMALIEHETIPKAEGFQLALAALETAGEDEALQRGVAAAKDTLVAAARLANSILSARQLHLAGPFSYFIVQEGCAEAAAMRGPLWLSVVARWVASATARTHSDTSNSNSGNTRPLVASAPLGDGRCLVLGIPPRFRQETRNLFGAAFEQAATKSGVSVSLDYVDSSVITLPVAQRAQFLDALTALLA